MFFFCLWIVVRCFFFLYWPLRPSYLTWINSSETWILTSYSGPAPPVTAKCHCLDLEETEKNLNLRLISYLGFPILKAARQVQQHLPPPIKKNLKYYSKKKKFIQTRWTRPLIFFFPLHRAMQPCTFFRPHTCSSPIFTIWCNTPFWLCLLAPLWIFLSCFCCSKWKKKRKEENCEDESLFSFSLDNAFQPFLSVLTVVFSDCRCRVLRKRGENQSVVNVCYFLCWFFPFLYLQIFFFLGDDKRKSTANST